MADNPLIKPKKKYTVGDRVIIIRPLSFFELLSLPEGLISSIMSSIPQGADSITEKAVYAAIRINIPAHIGDILELSKEEMKEISGADGVNMIADWLKLNLTENFLEGIGRAVTAGKQAYMKLSKPLSTTDIRPLKSGDTPSDKLKGISKQ